MDNFRDLAKSVLSFSSAATLFGTSQVGRLLNRRGADRAGDRVARRLDEVVHAASRSFEGPLWTAFTRADSAQRGLVDIVADVVRLDPAGLLASSGPLLQPALSPLNPLISAIDRAIPDRAIELQWLELNNKIEIYFLVQNAVARLGISPHERAPLPELAERAYALGPFLALWAVEGLGHYYAAEAMKDDPAPRGLLTSAEAEDVPTGSLLMLHAGIGLAFAQRLLGSITPQTPRQDVRATVEEFVRLCRENSRPGYVGAAYESLGLVTRTFHPQLLEVVEREVQPLGDELLGYFWHGVGRAIYFAPRNFLPCNRIDWSRVADAAPHEIGRMNIIAGLAWATTLVNMRQPDILLDVLRGQSAFLEWSTAFGNGLKSSLVMRQDTTPGADVLRRFCDVDRRAPARDAGPDFSGAIGGACRDALFRIYPALSQAGRLDEVFRYQDLDALAARLPTEAEKDDDSGSSSRSTRIGA